MSVIQILSKLKKNPGGDPEVASHFYKGYTIGIDSKWYSHEKFDEEKKKSILLSDRLFRRILCIPITNKGVSVSQKQNPNIVCSIGCRIQTINPGDKFDINPIKPDWRVTDQFTEAEKESLSVLFLEKVLTFIDLNS